MPEIVARQRRWLVRLGLVIALAMLARQIGRWAASGFVLQVDDFVEYWAAGRLFLSGGNPYDPTALLELQRAVGWGKPQALMMWNPPWILALIVPFSLLPYPIARIAWFVLHVVLTVLGGGLLWRSYRPWDLCLWPGWILAICFLPTLFAIRMGQIAPFLFIGWVAFLWWERRQRDILAGAFLTLVTLKPYLFYLFWLFFILWIWQRRRWRILIGLGITFILAIGVLMVHSPALPAQYLAAMSDEPPLYWATPTPGMLLRLLLGVDRLWLQFVPSFVGGLIGLYLARRWGTQWTWQSAGPLILLLSINTTSFGWSFDQVIGLPAIIRSATYTLGARRWRWWAWLAAFGLIEALTLVQNMRGVNEIWFVWLAPAWLLLYLLSLPPERWVTDT